MASIDDENLAVNSPSTVDMGILTVDLNPDQPLSPFSVISEPVQAKKPRKKRAKQSASDFLLLQATDSLKPYNAPKRQMTLIWQKIAERVSEAGTARNSKCCSDRMRDLLRKYGARKNVKDPTGDGQQPEPTEEEQLLQNIEACEEEGKVMSETQKEKATEEQNLIDQLEQDTLKPFSKKSRGKDVYHSDEEWEDDYTRDKMQAEKEAAGCSSVVFSTPTKKHTKGPHKPSPWKKTPTSARRGKDDLFREKFRLDADIRKEEIQDRKDERKFQRAKFRAEKAEKEEERKMQRENQERSDALRREELSIQRQNGDMLRDIVLSLVKKN